MYAALNDHAIGRVRWKIATSLHRPHDSNGRLELLGAWIVVHDVNHPRLSPTAAAACTRRAGCSKCSLYGECGLKMQLESCGWTVARGTPPRRGGGAGAFTCCSCCGGHCVVWPAARGPAVTPQGWEPHG